MLHRACLLLRVFIVLGSAHLADQIQHRNMKATQHKYNNRKTEIACTIIPTV
jgi:hypothetical protein